MKAKIAFSRPVSATIVLVGIAVIGLLALFLASARLDALTEERDAKSELVARALATGRKSAAVTEAPGRGLTVGADSATLAAATVDGLVRTTVIDAGGVVLSSKAETKGADPVGGPNERIEIQAVVQGSMEALQASLYHLESGQPLILVDALDIRASEDADVGARTLSSPMLTATLTLSAFWGRPPP